MELFSKAFRKIIRELLDDPTTNLLLTIPLRDVHPLVAEIRRLDGAVLIEVTKENRDHLPEDIVLLFKN